MRFGFRELVFLVVLLAVPAVSFFYLFQPLNDEIAEALLENRSKQERLDRLAEVMAERDDLDLAIEQGREALEYIEGKLPPERNVEGVLEEVWQITANNGMTVKSVKTEKSLPATKYRELPLKMVVEGQFDGFYQFLLELEALPRITRIHEMKVERAGAMSRRNSSDEPSDVMKASFTLSIYFEAGSRASA